jgi:hypothetical protein
MSDAGRKDFSTKMKEGITPDSSKSTQTKMKETVTDGTDKFARGAQPDHDKVRYIPLTIHQSLNSYANSP